jgi:hypothetical protein
MIAASSQTNPALAVGFAARNKLRTEDGIIR